MFYSYYTRTQNDEIRRAIYIFDISAINIHYMFLYLLNQQKINNGCITNLQLLRHCPMPPWPPPPPLFPFVAGRRSSSLTHNTHSRDEINYDRRALITGYDDRAALSTALPDNNRDRALDHIATRTRSAQHGGAASRKLLVPDESERKFDNHRGGKLHAPPAATRCYTCCTGCTFALLPRFMQQIMYTLAFQALSSISLSSIANKVNEYASHGKCVSRSVSCLKIRSLLHRTIDAERINFVEYIL